MPFIPKSALERIRELESHLRDSVPGDVYERSLARVAELERRNDWAMDMLLRRGQSLPVPPAKAEGEKPPPTPPPISETSLAQAEAIVAEGERVNASRQEIEDALRGQPGMTEEVIAEALRSVKRL